MLYRDAIEWANGKHSFATAKKRLACLLDALATIPFQHDEDGSCGEDGGEDGGDDEHWSASNSTARVRSPALSSYAFRADLLLRCGGKFSL